MNEHFEPNEQCLDRGLLVSLRDGELSADENVHALNHLIGCADRSADELEVRKSGQDVYTLLDTLNPSASEMPNTTKAFAAFHAKIAAEQHPTKLRVVPLSTQRGQQSLQSMARKHVRFRWITIAVAAALIAVIILPNAGVLASQFLALFHVQQFQPVRLDANQSAQNLYNNLTNFGTVKMTNMKLTDLKNPTKAQVEHYTHFSLLLPASLPQGVSDTPHYSIFNGDHATFTFDAAKARATIQQMGDGNVHIPAQLDGAVYTITIASGVGIQYALNCNGDASTTACSNQKQLDVAEVPSPVVQGASANALNDLRGFMLLLPHLSTDVHNLWQNVDASTGTVPLPLPSAQTNAEKVSINGIPGVLLVDTSIKYGGAIWQKGGIVYAVIANTDDRTQILKTAKSLQ